MAINSYEIQTVQKLNVSNEMQTVQKLSRSTKLNENGTQMFENTNCNFG